MTRPRGKIKLTTLVLLLALSGALICMSVMTAVFYQDLVGYVRARTTEVYQSDLIGASDRLHYALSKMRNVTNQILQDASLRQNVAEYRDREGDILARVPLMEQLYEQLPMYLSEASVDHITLVSEDGMWSVGKDLLLGETLSGMAAKLNLDLESLRERAAPLFVPQDIRVGVTRRLREGSIFYVGCMYDGDRPLALVLVRMAGTSLQFLSGERRYVLLMNGQAVWPGQDPAGLAPADWAEAILRSDMGQFTPQGLDGARVFFKRQEEDAFALLLVENQAYRQGSLQTLVKWMALALVLSAFVCVLLSAMLVKRITRPITGLIARVRSYKSHSAREGEDPLPRLRLSMQHRIVLFLMLAVGLPMALYLVAYDRLAGDVIRKEVTASYENSFAQSKASLALLFQAKMDVCEAVGMDYAAQTALLTGGPRAAQTIGETVAKHCKLRGLEEFIHVYDQAHALIYSSVALDTGNVFERYGIALPLKAGYTWPGIRRDALNRPVCVLLFNVKSAIINTRYLNMLRQPIGAVALIVEEEELERAYSQLYRPGAMEVYLTGADGAIVSSTYKNLLGQPLPEERYEGWLRYEVAVEGTPLIYHAFYTAGSIDAGIGAVLYNKVYLMVLLYAGLVLAFYELLNHMMRQMGRLAHNAASGNFIDLAEFYNDDSRIAEMDELGRTFNDMKQRIDQLLDDLIRARMNETNLLVKRREAEIHSLQSQIRPHFLCNVLESARSLIKMGQVEAAAAVMGDLGDLFRYSLSKTDPVVALEEELMYVGAYCNIMRRRYGEQIRFEIDAPPETRAWPVLKLLLTPLIENALEHGFPGPGDAGTVRVSCRLVDDELILCVRDDGMGMKADAEPSPRRGVGLCNVRQRLQLHYGERGRMRIESECGRGTAVWITIPKEASPEAYPEETSS
ncbi:MAG TPA: sensor histidine kinase [Clostridia bacterium]|nr:sensor histidine kinase [Clostridia bacterium]